MFSSLRDESTGIEDTSDVAQPKNVDVILDSKLEIWCKFFRLTNVDSILAILQNEMSRGH